MTDRKSFLPRAVRRIPPPPTGWFDIAYSIAFDGTLACFRANSDVAAAWARRYELQSQYQGIVPEEFADEIRKPLFSPGTVAKICTIGGELESQTGEFLLEYPFPKFDYLASGHWVIAAARCEVGFRNARIIDEQGHVRARLCLGDGIEHLQCDDNNKIWVGYFDEGVFGNFGWGGANAAPLGESGLVLFDADGAIDWTYIPPHPEGPPIYDCYALNVGNAGVWCCIYSDFPILRIQTAGKSQVWSNEIAGARAIAIHDRYLALLGGYGEDETRLALVRLENESAEIVSQHHLDIGDIRHAALVTGRGDTLHVVSNRTWYKISVPELLATVGK